MRGLERGPAFSFREASSRKPVENLPSPIILSPAAIELLANLSLGAPPMAREDFLDRRAGRWGFTLEDVPRRPHTVFITIDMVPPDFYRPGEVNSGLVRTPNIDSLRGRSVEFTNAFATSPLCGPSRAGYLTGRYPYVLANEERVHDGWEVELRADDVIFPRYLKAAGYLTKHVGKSHVGASRFIEAFDECDAPWNRWAPPMADDDGYLAYLSRLGVGPPVCDNPVTGKLPDGVTPGNSYGGFVVQSCGKPFPEAATYPHYLAALAEERIAAAVTQGAGVERPLYLQVDFFAPHQPFMIPGGLEDRAVQLRGEVRVPESFHEAKKHNFADVPGQPRIFKLYRRDHGIHDEETLKEYITMNILQMEVLDRAIGKVLESLDARGFLDEALVILTADHGEMNGERALVDKGVYGHPRIMRVPLYVKPPNATAAAAVVAAPVSLLDIAPTVLSAAGVTPRARLDGWSLLRLVESAGELDETPWNERIILWESFWHIAPNPAVAFTWRRSADEHYLFVCNLCDESDELFDLADAGHVNMIDAPGMREVRREMIRRLGAFLEADARWRCYLFPFRLTYADVLPRREGDQQMFRPT